MKPKLLFFITRPPLPAQDGTREMVLNDLKTLAADFTIDIFITADEKISAENADRLRSLAGGELFYFYRPKWRRSLRAFRHIFSGLPLQTAYFHSRQAIRQLDRRAKSYDAFYFHTIRTGPYIFRLRKKFPNQLKRCLLNLNDAISLNYQSAREKASGFWRLIYAWEEKRVKNYELTLLAEPLKAMILTERDKNHLSNNWLEERQTALPDKIIIRRYSISNVYLHYNYSPKSQNLVFIGNLAYPPNQQGLHLFCRQIWPLLVEKIPDSELIIIGLGAEGEFSRYPRVHQLGFIEKPYQLMAEQAAFLNPVHFGGGVSSKSLLAMALGLPVISTPLGLAGLEKIREDHNAILIDYDDPRHAAEKIASVLNNPALLKKISQNEKELVRSLYSQSVNNQILRDIFRRLIES